MRELKKVLLVLALISSLSGPAVAADCGPHKAFMVALMKRGFSYESTFVTDQEMVMQLLVNPTTREWVFISVDDNMQSCLIAHGPGWYPAKEITI